MRIFRRLAAAVLLLVVTVGIPVVLVVTARWPLPRHLPDWSRVATALRHGDLPSEVIVKALACVVWVCWAQLAWAVVWEFTAQLRHPHDAPAQHEAPLVPRSVHLGVGRVVAFVLAAGVALATTPTPAFAGPGTPVVAAGGSPPPARPPVVAPAEPQSPVPSVWVVAAGDTVWDIAESALGDGGRTSEILELNPHLVPHKMRVGTRLTLPSDASIPTDRRTAPDLPAPSDGADASPTTFVVDAPGYLPEITITIRPGDNLWHLAATRVDAVNGDAQASDQEVAGYVGEIVAGNTIESGDPALLHPGEQYAFPAVGAPPVEPPAVVAVVQPTTAAPTPELPPPAPGSPNSVATTTVVPTTAAPATTPTSVTCHGGGAAGWGTSHRRSSPWSSDSSTTIGVPVTCRGSSPAMTVASWWLAHRMSGTSAARTSAPTRSACRPSGWRSSERTPRRAAT